MLMKMHAYWHAIFFSICDEIAITFMVATVGYIWIGRFRIEKIRRESICIYPN